MATATETTTSIPTTNGTESAPRMTHLPQIQKTYTPPLIANENAFLGDVATSEANVGKDKAVTSGFFHLAPGTPLVYTYTYHEMKIILEGDYTITDVTAVSEEQRKGDLKGWDVQRVEAKPGDVFYFPEGVTIRFETVAGGKAFYTGQRAEGAA